MPNQMETIDELKRFLAARVPVIVLHALETDRAIDVVSHVAASLRGLPFYIYSTATGLCEMERNQPVNDDRSLSGALDYALSVFRSRPNTNFVFLGIEGLDTESQTARHFVEVSRIAEHASGCLLFVTSGPVWSGLARRGMTTELDLPDVDELADRIRRVIDDNRSDRLRVDWGEAEIRQAAETLQGITWVEANNIVSTLFASGHLRVDDLSRLSEYKDRIFGNLAGLERIKLKKNDFEIGGLESLRNWLRQREELMKTDLSHSPLHPPKGVLLCGVPGCGKSLSAKAIAAEWRLPLYRLDMAAILGMYVGESESRLREALDTADRVAPCILWIDEIEKGLAGGGDAGVTRRLVGQFLFWLQESDSKVFMVATANDVSALPPELLRKGRFDEIFFVDLPTDAERQEIIGLYFRKYMGQDPSPYLLDDLVQLSDGFSGADIEATCHEIATAMLFRKTTELPDEGFIKASFAGTVPFGQSNPEDLAAIRAWGRERAVPASTSSTPAWNAEPGRPQGRRLLSLG